MVKNLSAKQGAWVQPLSKKDPLEKGMTIHSSILAWRSLWTEKPGGLQSVGSQNWTRLSDYAQHTVESAPACPCQNTFHDIEKESNCWAHLCNFKTVLFSWIVSRLIIELRIKAISKSSLIFLNTADCLYLQKGTFCNSGLQTCKDACHQLSNCTLPRARTSHNTGLRSSSSKQELLFLFLDRAWMSRLFTKCFLIWKLQHDPPIVSSLIG